MKLVIACDGSICAGIAVDGLQRAHITDQVRPWSEAVEGCVIGETIPSRVPFDITGSWFTSSRPMISRALMTGVSIVSVRS